MTEISARSACRTSGIARATARGIARISREGGPIPGLTGARTSFGAAPPPRIAGFADRRARNRRAADLSGQWFPGLQIDLPVGDLIGMDACIKTIVTGPITRISVLVMSRSCRRRPNRACREVKP